MQTTNQTNRSIIRQLLRMVLFGDKSKKGSCNCFGKNSIVIWNSFKNSIISNLTVSQQALKKLKLNPFGPGLLLPSQFHKASRTSSLQNSYINTTLSSSFSTLKSILEKKGRLCQSSEKFFSKCCFTSSFIQSTPWIQTSSFLIETNWFFLLRPLILAWKYLEFASPSYTSF
jgi:hypothetical protein